jgi:putative FmdB family regulatory protein
MPLYEFHCDNCNEDSEILVRYSDWKGTQCPRCGSTNLTKNLSVFASAVPGNTTSQADCSGNPRSCGMCGTGRPHSH